MVQRKLPVRSSFRATNSLSCSICHLTFAVLLAAHVPSRDAASVCRYEQTHADAGTFGKMFAKECRSMQSYADAGRFMRTHNHTHMHLRTFLGKWHVHTFMRKYMHMHMHARSLRVHTCASMFRRVRDVPACAYLHIPTQTCTCIPNQVHACTCMNLHAPALTYIRMHLCKTCMHVHAPA